MPLFLWTDCDYPAILRSQDESPKNKGERRRESLHLIRQSSFNQKMYPNRQDISTISERKERAQDESDH